MHNHLSAEVRCAIRKLKNGRAAGPDSIPPELLKCAETPISKALPELFLKVWSSGRVPSDWRNGVILPIQRKRSEKTMQQLQTYNSTLSPWK